MGMTKDIIDGQERFDGIPVTLYDGKFAGTFEIDEETALTMSYDDVVTFVVTAHVGAAKIDATKMGDMKRSNTFDVTNVVHLNKATADKVYQSLGSVTADDEPELPLNAVPGEPWDDDDFDEDEIFSPQGTGVADSMPASMPYIPVTNAPKKDSALASFLAE